MFQKNSRVKTSSHIKQTLPLKLSHYLLFEAVKAVDEATRTIKMQIIIKNYKQELSKQSHKNMLLNSENLLA